MLPSRRSESHSPASRCKSAGHPLTTNGFHSIPSSASSSTHSMNRQGSVDNLIFKLLTRQKYVAKCLGFVPARSSVAIQTTPIVERDLVGCFQTEASSFEVHRNREFPTSHFQQSHLQPDCPQYPQSQTKRGAAGKGPDDIPFRIKKTIPLIIEAYCSVVFAPI
ncbi:hypothetical protein CRE_26341 [Caenorhabditis remanei]|uniref:Uncharacterized protein n=1 Tax=Caenorhabditis remanei TaxID=31234 RepID=E3LRI6_CAERE|nr:hypothetical protein CRE_26341 [Caenorhabditis remanei]